MSGQLNPEHQQRIEATDDKALADQHGLTEWDEGRGQWVKPPQTSDVGTRDSGASGPPVSPTEEEIDGDGEIGEGEQLNADLPPVATKRATGSAKPSSKKPADEDKDHPVL